MEREQKCTCCHEHRPQKCFFEKVKESVVSGIPLFMWFILGASFIFITSGIFDRFFITDKGDLWVIRQLGVVENIPNSTLLAILSLLATFSGVLVYVFKEIVKRDLQEKMQKGIDNHNETFNKKILETRQEIEIIAENERTASRAENYLDAASSFLSMYQFTHINDLNAEKLKTVFKEGESDLMKKSISLVKLARKQLINIKSQGKDGYNGLFLRAKNNLAVCVAFSFRPNKEDIADADKFSKENYDLAQNNKQGESPKYIYEATRALVLLRFSTNSMEADRIYKNLLREVNQDGISVSDVSERAKEEIRKNKRFIEKMKVIIGSNTTPKD